MNRLFPVTLLPLFLLSSCIAAQDSQPTERLRLGTWNLENFGARNPPRSPEDYKKIAAFIRELGVAVLAVQEINGPVPLRRLCAQLGPSWQFVVGESGSFRGEDKRISVGFLWNKKRVSLLQCEEMEDFPRMAGSLPIYHRLPVSAVFRALDANGQSRLDFRAITVHFKASRGQKNENKRREEVKVLRQYLEKLLKTAGEDQDIVVLGDFNHTYGAPAHEAFAADQFVRYLEAPGRQPTIVHFDDPIDQIAITPGLAEEVIAQSFKVRDSFLRVKEAADDRKALWRSIYSDHLPVTVDLDAGADRDPEAGFSPARHPLTVGGRKGPAAAQSDHPFGPGTRVWILLEGSEALEGTLLAPPGQWVCLRLASGEEQALPARRIKLIRKLK